VNAVSFRELPGVEAVCRIVVESGFDSLELSRPWFYDKLTTSGTRRRFAEWAEEIGLSLYGFDCWVEVEPYVAFDETIAEFRKAVAFAADLELGMIISHDPWAAVNGDRAAAACLKTNIELFRRVADMAAAAGLKLVFEPHPDTLSMQNSWAIDFVDSVAEGHAPGTVGILYDCCHYGVGQPNSYVDSVRVLGKRILHLHFSDGDGETHALHLPIGDGNLDLAGIVSELKHIGYGGTLTNDLYNYPLLEDGARRNAPQVREVERHLGLASP
jgi:sugar phosphate isomerase/epimerase